MPSGNLACCEWRLGVWLLINRANECRLIAESGTSSDSCLAVVVVLVSALPPEVAANLVLLTNLTLLTLAALGLGLATYLRSKLERMERKLEGKLNFILK